MCGLTSGNSNQANSERCSGKFWSLLWFALVNSPVCASKSIMLHEFRPCNSHVSMDKVNPQGITMCGLTLRDPGSPESFQLLRKEEGDNLSPASKLNQIINTDNQIYIIVFTKSTICSQIVGNYLIFVGVYRRYFRIPT